MNEVLRRAPAVGLVLLLCVSFIAVVPGQSAAEPYEISSSVDDLNVGRLFSAVVAIDDKVYMFGGCTHVDSGGEPVTTLDSVLVYDVMTGEESMGAPMIKGVGLSAYALGDDGKVYIIGGWNSTDSTYYGSVQIYDPVADSWSLNVNSTPEAIGYCASTLGNDGRIYMFGGGWADNATIIYDPVLDMFTYGTSIPMPSGVFGASAVTLSDTAILVVGGVNKEFWTATTMCHIYNPVADEWSSAASLSNNRTLHSTVLARNGYVYALGGVDDDQINSTGPILSSIERYDIGADTWEMAMTSLDWSRAAHGSVEDSYGRIWSVSGYNGGSITKVEFLLVAETAGMRELVVTSPADGSTVNGVVVVEASLVNSFFNLIYGAELYVDGELHESQSLGNYWAFTWDTTGLPDKSVHELLVRGYDYDGTVMDVSLSVTVSTMSADEKLDALEAELATAIADLAALEAQLDDVNDSLAAGVADLMADIISLSAELDDLSAAVESGDEDLLDEIQALQGQLSAVQSELSDLLGALNETEDSVDDVQASVDNKMDGTLGLAIIGLLVVVILLMIIMMVMGRKPKTPLPEAPPEPPID